MITHRIEEIPIGFDYFLSSELDPLDIAEVPNSISELWYWFAFARYEGVGHMLMRAEDGSWHHHDCMHCSCSGPTDHISLEDGSSLDDLLARCSADLRKELKPLTDAISQTNQTK